MKLWIVARTVGCAIAIVAVPALAAAQQHADRPAIPSAASPAALQQDNVPAAARQAEGEIEEAVRRFRVGVEAGVALDPELIVFGAHGAFGPLFRNNIEFRPGLDIGVGELTTTLGIDLDVLYLWPGTAGSAWRPYIGAGPNFGLSHRDVDADDVDDDDEDDDRNRFDFSDTDFEGGMNFVAGVRKASGLFVEMKATAYGVSNIRLVVGFNF